MNTSKEGAPRELYRVSVDLDRWIADDPGPRPGKEPWHRPRVRPTSSRNDYRGPIYTISKQQVTGIIAQFGADYVAVEYADLGALGWKQSRWPRRKPALVLYGDGQARCPHCEATDSIVEIDHHHAENEVHVDGQGDSGVKQESVRRVTLRFECRECRGEVLLPSEPSY